MWIMAFDSPNGDDLPEHLRSQSTRNTMRSTRTTNTWATTDSYSMAEAVEAGRPISEIERARLRPMSVEESPRDSRDNADSISNPNWAPIRTASTRKPPAWFTEARSESRSQSRQQMSRNGSTRSREQPRESIVDLHLLVSDLDFYAGAVHDYGHEALTDDDGWDEDGEGEWPLPRDSDGSTFGAISILRQTAEKSLEKGPIDRKVSTRSKKSEKDVNLVTWDLSLIHI